MIAPWLAWTLVAAALALGWRVYGWQGALLVATLVVFWLLLQFNRAVRVMRRASGNPLARVASAVMLNARLRKGLTLLQVVAITHSLGRQESEAPETWRWDDDGGSGVTLVFERGRLARWTLTRPPGEPPPAP